MNNATVGMIVSTLLVGLGSLMPGRVTGPEFETIQVAQAPPLPPAPTVVIPPLPVAPVAPVAPGTAAVDPTRAGMIRTQNGTRLVSFLRPIGVADSCQWTTCNAPAGSQWLGKDERIYVKLADGSFDIRPTAAQRAAGAKPVDLPAGWAAAAADP